jgi:hypothetical protein
MLYKNGLLYEQRMQFRIVLKKIQKKSPAMKAGAFFVLMNVVISNVLQHFLNLHHLKRAQHIEAKGCY